ncbi:MAG: hypothetical protein AAB524_01535 [Patescibacteria group bacterium]
MPPWLQQAPIGPTSGAKVVALIENLTNWFFAGFMVLAVIFLVLAGWQFMSGGGEPQQIMKAKQKLLWAVVAIIAALLSRGVVAAIRAIIGG